MVGHWIKLLLDNFVLVMFVLAMLCIWINRMLVGKSVSESEIVFRWVCLLVLGFSGIYTFIFHAFYPQIAASIIGWQPSPFQFEVAMADLALGVLGILSFHASLGFRVATVIASICFLWGDAIGHVYQMINQHNFSPGNAGAWFWMDVFVPMILLICIINLTSKRSQQSKIFS